jgi:hypothetical protein
MCSGVAEWWLRYRFLWGLGYDIAERMGLMDAIERPGYHMREIRIVDESGRWIAGFAARVGAIGSVRTAV